MGKKKIIVIDDNLNFLESTKYILSKYNYIIITTPTGTEALNFLKNDVEIQVLLIDLYMPILSGVDFLKEIKDFERPLKRIVLTAEESLLDEQEAEDLKIFSYLVKSVNITHSLLFTVKSAFNELELDEVKQWKDLALITTDTVHLIGNKISPIRRRIDEISKTLIKLVSDNIISKEIYEKIDRDVQIIKDSAEQTYSIKSDLIDRSINKQQVNIIKILSEVVSNCKIDNNQIDINYNVPKNDLFIIADELFLKRVFSNIITNAIHAIEDKNLLRKEITYGEVSIDAYLNNNFLFVDFKDNGCGIEERDINRVFLPFFTTKGADRGNGIGLYFCKRTIEDIGGEIRIIENKIGVGTTFSLKFPIAILN
jgi:signal transduction histidine kinase